MTPQEQENLKKRIDKYNTTKQTTPVFSFMQEVIVNEWFYNGYKGKVYKEIDFMPHPDHENNRDEWVVTSYEVVVMDDKWETIDRRLIEAKYMSSL